jgi:hypothetical protein
VAGRRKNFFGGDFRYYRNNRYNDKEWIMRSQTAIARNDVRYEPVPIVEGIALHDLRFRGLLGATAWSELPSAVRRRFSTRAQAGDAITYAGEVVDCGRTLFGRLVAELCRVIGAPLPLSDDIGVPAIVTVTEDGTTGGQFWTRMYGRTRGFPQVIHSSKRFTGPTGLEEYLGCGFGIALTVSADREALRFHSDHYFLAFGSVRFRLPRWLAPGELTISHVDCGYGEFAFVLALRHKRFGLIIHQTGLFHQRFASVRGENCDE